VHRRFWELFLKTFSDIYRKNEFSQEKSQLLGGLLVPLILLPVDWLFFGEFSTFVFERPYRRDIKKHVKNLNLSICSGSRHKVIYQAYIKKCPTLMTQKNPTKA
jgi:hypothetical protein